MELDKKEMIEALISILEKEEIDIIGVSSNNENETIGGQGKIENAWTGYKTIEIQLLNTKVHSNFVKKLQNFK